MNSENKRTGIFISLKDLFWYVISAWRVLLICLLAGILVLGALSCYKSIKRSSSQQDLSSKGQSIEKDLNLAQKANANNYANTLIRTMNDYEFLDDYYHNSLFQNLNPKNVTERLLTFYVDNTSGASVRDTAELSSIIEAYKGSLLGDTLAENVASEFGINKEDSFYYYDGVVDLSNKYINEEDRNDSIGEGTLLIYIYGEDTAFLDSMEAAVTNTINSLAEGISESVGNHSIKLSGKSDKLQSDNYVYKKQNDNAERMKAILSDIDIIKGDLDSDLLTYVEYLVVSKYDGDYLNIAFSDIEMKQSSPKVSISKKYVLAGAFLGFVMAVVVLIIIYLTKGRVRCYDDIEYTYGVSVLGTYDDPKAAAKRHKTALDKWIRSKRIKRKSQDRNDAVALIARKLELLAKKNEVSSICVAVGPECAIDESFLNDVSAEIREVKISVGEDILRNAKAIENMCSAQAVVLLEQVDKSTFAKIDEEFKMCSSNNVNILGVIIAE